MSEMWHGCYDGGWQGVIVPESFAHPAKMSYGLLKRILSHAQEQGWLNGIILDPFGGIGSTGILGAYEGYQVVCVELERKFVELAEQNFKLHDNAWRKLGNPYPMILQGDSRRLCEVVEKADCIVSSPPYMGQDTNIFATANQGKRACDFNDEEKRQRKNGAMGSAGYRNLSNATPGQLGAMKPGNPPERRRASVDMVVSSPPYAESLKGDGTQNETAKESYAKRTDKSAGGPLGQSQRTQGYGSKGNLGNLKSGDPPEKRRASVDCVISSPPYENGCRQKGGLDPKPQYIQSGKKDVLREYGQTVGQLGQEQGDTFWSAAKIIVEQCFQILKPGGHVIWVVKAFVRNKKIVDFPGDWQRLCESVGFKTLCVHHAMLVKETKNKTLFGHTEVKRKERKSFFRRLAESKGSPRIDYEVVLCMRKNPAGAERRIE